jgi:hypothetical protein
MANSRLEGQLLAGVAAGKVSPADIDPSSWSWERDIERKWSLVAEYDLIEFRSGSSEFKAFRRPLSASRRRLPEGVLAGAHGRRPFSFSNLNLWDWLFTFVGSGAASRIANLVSSTF